MASKKKPTKREIESELQRAAHDYDEIRHVLRQRMLWNVASHLGMAPEELEDQWADLTLPV